MPAAPDDRRALTALAQVLASVDAVRNGRAWYVLLLAFALAGMFLSQAEVAMAAGRSAVAAAWGGLSLTVLFYGSNTAGLLLLDDARSQAPREVSQAFRDALGSAHRLLLVLLAVFGAAALGLAVVAAVLALARLPGVGAALFGLTLPAAVLAVGTAALAVSAVAAPLAAPAIWSGLSVRAALALLAAQVRQRLIFVALLMGAVSGLTALVGVLASFVVVVGGRVVSMLAVLVAGVEVPPAVLMSGLFGRGLRSLGASSATLPPEASPYVSAALIGGGLVFMLALVLPALVYLRGTCAVYLALEARDAS